ncbi:MAG: gamma-glutamyltransferase [Agarilytica sp.]
MRSKTLWLWLWLGTLSSTQVFALSAQDYARNTKNGEAAVASVNPIATQAGLDALANGGNAIDAAVAMAFTLGVVDSHNSGIGGGCFILVRKADGELIAIDGREMAPAKAHRDMFIRDGKAVKELSKSGALAIGVPGSVAALHHLQKNAGKLKFEELILPAAKIAGSGFEIDPVMAKRLQRTEKSIRKYPATAGIFLDVKGNAKKEGDLLIQKDLAKTYRLLAKHGPDYFYRGEFAKRLDKWMSGNSGVVTLKDFQNYQIKLRQPIQSQFQSYTVVGFPPPSSGGAHVAQILNILENFDLKKLTELERYHLIIEAMKLAFADRAYWMGDADFVNVPKGIISPVYAKQLAEKISLDAAANVLSHSTPPNMDDDLFTKHTTHIASADKDGNWVAITTTLNTSFGSKVVIPGTGVLMNNQMDDFSAQPGVPNAFGLIGAEANAVDSGKRPLSSMSPTIVLKDGEPVFSVGAAGGPTIISQVLQVIVNKIGLGKTLEESLAAARVHHQWRPNTVYYDAFAPSVLVEGLEAFGHSMRVWPPFGATQAIALEKGKFVAVTEPRLVQGRR